MNGIPHIAADRRRKIIMNRGRNNYGTIRLCPHIMQFAIDGLPLILLNMAGYVCAGMDVIPLKGLILGISILLSSYLLYLFIYIRKMDFVVTGEQLIHEHGVFVRDSDYIELYRVVDFKENRSFLQQLAGLKTVSVYSGDRNTPRLDIIGVRNSMNLVAHIRERVEYNKQRKGIYEITNR